MWISVNGFFQKVQKAIELEDTSIALDRSCVLEASSSWEYSRISFDWYSPSGDYQRDAAFDSEFRVSSSFPTFSLAQCWGSFEFVAEKRLLCSAEWSAPADTSGWGYQGLYDITAGQYVFTCQSWYTSWFGGLYPDHTYVLRGPNAAPQPERSGWMKFRFRAVPDVIATSLVWNRVLGGIDVGYKMTDVFPDQRVFARVSWSKGPTVDDIISPPVYTFWLDDSWPLGTEVFEHILSTQLGLPPDGATHLVLEIDPDNLVEEWGESNNILAWKSNLSGRAWCQAYAEQWKGNTDITTLDQTFRAKVYEFIGLLEGAGATVHPPISVYRPIERAYLMHFSWLIVNPDDKRNINPKTKQPDPTEPALIPPYAGVDINWDYGNDELSRAAAAQMVSYFKTGSYAAFPSKHSQYLAIDMQVEWTGTLSIKMKGATTATPITTGPRNADNIQLGRVAATYGVYRVRSDTAPHWQSP
ncbi:MAG: hypothetical protein ACYC4B_19570 [Pirellulaceae bacterium]